MISKFTKRGATSVEQSPSCAELFTGWGKRFCSENARCPLVVNFVELMPKEVGSYDIQAVYQCS